MNAAKFTPPAAGEAANYVSICPDTGRVFVCVIGQDNNVAEVFAHSGRTAKQNAAASAARLLQARTLAAAGNGLLESRCFRNDLKPEHHAALDAFRAALASAKEAQP